MDERAYAPGRHWRLPKYIRIRLVGHESAVPVLFDGGADVTADGNYRQGLSIIGAKHMLVERCNFSNTVSRVLPNALRVVALTPVACCRTGRPQPPASTWNPMAATTTWRISRSVTALP